MSANHQWSFSRRRLLSASGAIAIVAALGACGSGQSVSNTAAAATSTSPTTSTPSRATAGVTPGSTTPEGATEARFPDGVQVFGSAGAPAVLFVHPWWGISPGVLAWKDTLVAAGARVVLPDLYGGKVADTIAEADAMSNALDQRTAVALLDACADQLNATGQHWSALGLSLGAFLVSQMIGRGDRAPYRAVLFYGAAPLTGTSRTETVQLHVAPEDPYFTNQEIAAALRGFEQAGIIVEEFEYPGLGHWFAEVGSPAYDEAGTAQATERTLTFLGLATG